VKLRTRFVLAVVVLVVLIAGMVAGAQFLAIDTTNELGRLGGQEIALISKMTHGFAGAGTAVYRYATIAEPGTRADLAEHLSVMHKARIALAHLEAVPGGSESAADVTLGGALVSQIDAFSARADQVIADRTRSGTVPIMSLVAFSSASEDLEGTLGSLAAVESAKTAKSAQGTASRLSLLVSMVGLSGLGVIIIGAIIAGILLRSISRPVRALQSASAALAKGDMDYPVDPGRKDEFGELNRAFVSMRSELQGSMNNLQDEADRRAEAQERYQIAAQDVGRVNVELEEQIRERHLLDEELEHVNDRLKDRLAEVAVVTDEMSILAEMGSMLQSDVESDEAYGIVARYAEALLPGASGALYVVAPSRNLFDRVMTWGRVPPQAQHFVMNDCWSLRLGRPNVPEENHVVADCAHVEADDHGSYVCAPMSAHGDAIGVMVFYHLVSQCSVEEHDAAGSRRRGLALNLAEQVALALSNLGLRETLREQSIKDPLTGLYNRRYMEDAVEREFARARRTDSPISFVMMDIDHFKAYNDRTGHGAGDAVLAAVGAYLRDATRSEDVACRYGGEEFLLIFPGADGKAAVARAEQIRDGIKSLRVQLRDRMLPGITISMGVSQLRPSDSSVDSAITAADEALYIAKRGGRDCVRLSSEVEEPPLGVLGTTGYEEPVPREEEPAQRASDAA
jgi:diguanylate cyclase (GGDEF)-like protein